MLMDWAKNTSHSLDQIIDPNRPGIVLATYPDISNFYIAKKIHQKYAFPIVLDLRDDYFNEPIDEFLSISNAVLTTTDTLRQKIINNFKYPEQQIHTVLNGYDGPSIESISHANQNDDKIFKIVYAGAIAKHQKPKSWISRSGSR